MKVPQIPTTELIDAYILSYDNRSAGETKCALDELAHVFPKNNRLQQVMLKVTAVDGLYSTGIRFISDGLYAVARHIINLDIDERLSACLPDVVNEIARTGLGKDVYSFASKYCSIHAPKAYPILDWYVAKVLWGYVKQAHFVDFKSETRFFEAIYTDYCQYKMVIEVFQTTYALEEYDFDDLDKFLWLYGNELYATPSTKT